jgi:hypothetical protein
MCSADRFEGAIILFDDLLKMLGQWAKPGTMARNYKI